MILVAGARRRRAVRTSSAPSAATCAATPASRSPRSRRPALRDALEQWTGRFAGLFVIRPAHNPLGPLDFDGVYDERSDRAHTLGELVDRGYEDAYRQFIEPVVGASGDRLEAVQR